MANIREISERRMDSLQDEFGKAISLQDIQHMLVSPSLIDLDRAKDWREVAAAERISKHPRRQSIDEQNQLQKVSVAYPIILKLASGSLFLAQGNLHSISPYPDALDIDAQFQDNNWSIVWTLKGGQKEDGTAQHRQFQNVMKTIDESPDRSSNQKVCLAVYVNGDFWTKSRKKYRGWEKGMNNTFSLMDVLKHRASNKKCVILTDIDIPTVVSSFYSLHIQGKF